jgi:hypothetical protein
MGAVGRRAYADRVSDARLGTHGANKMVKKGQLQVSKMDSPHQGEPRDPHAEKIQRRGGSHSQSRGRPPGEGSSSKG